MLTYGVAHARFACVFFRPLFARCADGEQLLSFLGMDGRTICPCVESGSNRCQRDDDRERPKTYNNTA